MQASKVSHLEIDAYILFVVFQMTSTLSIEDVRLEVKLLKALSGHRHMVNFYDVFENVDNVFIVME